METEAITTRTPILMLIIGPLEMLRGWCFVLGAAATMATAPLLNKLLSASLPPMVIAEMRTLLGVPFMLLILLVAGKSVPRKVSELKIALVAGTTMVAVPFGALAWGQQHIPSGMGGILYGLSPLLIVVGAMRFLEEERPGLRTLLGVFSGIVGVTLVVGPNVIFGFTLQGAGQLVTLIGPISYAAGSIYVRRVGGVDAISLTAAMYVFASFVLFPFAVPDFASLATIQGNAVAELLLLAAVGSVVPTILSYLAIREIGATRASLIMFGLPIFSVLYGVVLLDESFNYVVILGMVGILTGSLAISRR